MASLAEWERELLIERTREGVAHARAQGRVAGPKPKLSPEQARQALQLLAGGESVASVAKILQRVATDALQGHRTRETDRRMKKNPDHHTLEAWGFCVCTRTGVNLRGGRSLTRGIVRESLAVPVAVFVECVCCVIVSHWLAVLLPGSLSSRSRFRLVVCIRVVIYPHP